MRRLGLLVVCLLVRNALPTSILEHKEYIHNHYHTPKSEVNREWTAVGAGALTGYDPKSRDRQPIFVPKPKKIVPKPEPPAPGPLPAFPRSIKLPAGVATMAGKPLPVEVPKVSTSAEEIKEM
jgi:hypothetical protein